MKIAYVAGAQIPSPAAHSIQVMRMAHAFAQEGHDVTLIIPSPKQAEEDVFGYYGVKPNFHIVREARRGLKGGLLLWGVRVALRAKRLQPDLVYGRQIHACFFSGLLGLPVILEIHRPPTGRVTTALFSRLVSLPTFQRVVTNSGALARILQEEFSVPREKVLAAPNGAEDPPRVSPLELKNDGRLRVGYVGHMYEGRGVEIILSLAEACEWADFHLVGGTEADIARWRSRAAGSTNLIFHGFVAPSEVESYRRACDVLLAPYQREVMGTRDRDQAGYMSPLKLFEYMASGRAIVCADLPVLHEILRAEETALFCDPDDPSDWIQALSRLRDDPALRHALGDRARAVFERDFTRAARARRVLQGTHSQPGALAASE